MASCKVLLGIYRGYMGIVENKMETTIMGHIRFSQSLGYLAPDTKKFSVKKDDSFGQSPVPWKTMSSEIQGLPQAQKTLRFSSLYYGCLYINPKTESLGQMWVRDPLLLQIFLHARTNVIEKVWKRKLEPYTLNPKP